ncbi:MAG: GNAT family N-acetyltransferase [Verrucomicrobiota bacterium]
MNPVCREIAFGSEEYHRALELRDEVLRRPLGLAWTPAERADEPRGLHLGCFDGGRLLATMVLQPLDAATIRMRQVAVAEEARRGGIGTALAMHAEAGRAARGLPAHHRPRARARGAVLPPARLCGGGRALHRGHDPSLYGQQGPLAGVRRLPPPGCLAYRRQRGSVLI